MKKLKKFHPKIIIKLQNLNKISVLIEFANIVNIQLAVKKSCVSPFRLRYSITFFACERKSFPIIFILISKLFFRPIMFSISNLCIIPSMNMKTSSSLSNANNE